VRDGRQQHLLGPAPAEAWIPLGIDQVAFVPNGRREGGSQAGPSARFAGSDGDGPRIECHAPPIGPSRSGRAAWLVGGGGGGGGGDAEVVYSRPR
jgi:hypothetical protein